MIYFNFTECKYHCTETEVFHDGFLQQIWWTKQEIVNLVMFTEEVLNPFIHDVKKGSNMVKVGLKHG